MVMNSFSRLLVILLLFVTAINCGAEEFVCEQVESGVMYYIRNMETGKFLNDKNGFDNAPSVMWNIDLDNRTIASQKGRYVSCKAGILGIGTQWSTDASYDEETCVMRDIKYSADGYYTISKALATYLSVNDDELANDRLSVDGHSRWIMISKAQYDSITYDRGNLKQRLTVAIENAEKIKDLPAPATVKGSSNDLLGLLTPNAFYTTLSKAQTYLKEIDSKTLFGKYKHSESTILDGCVRLENATELVLQLTDYYVSALEEIEQIASLPGGLTTASAAAAKVAVNACSSKDGIKNALTALRAECMLLVRSMSLKPQDNLTGLITNHSFDMGDMTGWYTLGNILNTSMLPTVNADANAIEGGHNKFYYKAPTSISVGSQVYQPVFGLNEGVYQVSAKMLPMGLAREVGLTAYVIPNDVINLVPGDSITAEVIQRLTSNIADILRDAKRFNISKEMKDATSFQTVSLDVQLEENSFFIIALGSPSLVSSFAVDDVCLTYSHDIEPVYVPSTVATDSYGYYPVSLFNGRVRITTDGRKLYRSPSFCGY